MSGRLERIVGHLEPGYVSGESKAVVSIVSKEHGIAVIQINNPPVNSLHPSVMAGLQSCYKAAIEDSSITGIVFTGAGKFFMAGADIPTIANFQKDLANGASIDALQTFVANGHKFMNEVESGKKPVVAAVNGPALGGGCELAMACNARVALKSAKFGLPELNLGIIPGAGGSQRLPRLIGLAAAVKYTMTGKNISAPVANKMGLVDLVVKKPNQLLPAAIKACLAIVQGKAPRNRSLYLTHKIGSVEEGRVVIQGAKLQSLKRAPNVVHPGMYLDAVLVGLVMGGEEGLKKEQEVFLALTPTTSAKALVHMFLSSKITSKIPNVPAKLALKVTTVAVIGAGTMGAGIIVAMLSRGYKVILKEYNQAALLAGVDRIVDLVVRVIKKRKQNPLALEFIMRNLVAQTTYENFDKCQMVIEAAVENIPIKQAIFAKLEEICAPSCILATNTSTIDINIVGAKTNAMDRLVGLHFFSPAHIMPLLEIIKTEHTSPAAIATCVAVAKRIGKTPVVVGNCVAFTANRIFFPYGQAATLLLDRGVDPYRIDKALEKFGMPIGVFKMCDLSGIDIFKHVGGIIASAYGERVYRSTITDKFIKDGRLGQKTGKGFYEYKRNKPVMNLKAITGYIAASGKDAQATSQELSLAAKYTDEELIEMILYPIINESFRVLEEKMVYRESDIDVVAIMGYGFPAYRGGIMFWARSIGLKNVAAKLEHYSKTLGAKNAEIARFFKPCSNILKHAAQE